MRKVVTGQITKGFSRPAEGLRFYSRSNEEPLESFKQTRAVIRWAR